MRRLVILVQSLLVLCGCSSSTASITYPKGILLYKETQKIVDIKYEEENGGKVGYQIVRIILTDSGEIIGPVFQVERPQKKRFTYKKSLGWSPTRSLVFLEQNHIEFPIGGDTDKYLIMIRPVEKDLGKDENWRIWELDPSFLANKPPVLKIPKMKDLEALETRKDSKAIIDRYHKLLKTTN